MFILDLTYIAPIERVNAALPEHNAWLDAHYAAGTLLASGRKLPPDGGVIITVGVDRAKVEEMVKSDPFTVAGVAEYAITEFAANKTAPALESYREEFPD